MSQKREHPENYVYAFIRIGVHGEENAFFTTIGAKAYCKRSRVFRLPPFAIQLCHYAVGHAGPFDGIQMTLRSTLGTRLAVAPRRAADTPFSQAELNAIAKSHQDFLSRRTGGMRALLPSARLFGLDLSRRQFREANFSGADLSGANLRGGDFERAGLFCANMRDVLGSYANFKGADLRGAALRGADLSFSILDGADLRAAIMFKRDGAGNYSQAHAGKTSPSGGVDFSNCSMKGASLNDVNLKGANFRNAILHGVSFKRTKLSEVVLDGAVLTGVNAHELPFSEAELRTCVFEPTVRAISRVPAVLEKLKNHELWVASGSQSGEVSVLDDEDIRPLRNAFHRRSLTALSARFACAIGVNFSHSQLQGANFTGADLRDCNFEGADLRGAVFRDAKLAHACLKDADLRPLALANGSVQLTDFVGADHCPAQLETSIR